MWFRRIFRWRRRPPPPALSALDRLEGLVARVTVLVGELPLDAPVALEENGVPAAVPEPTVAVQPPPAAGCVLFLSGPEGYRLLPCEHEPPAPGERIELDGAPYRVLRHGPSPLPGDARRCAFLEP